MATTVYVLCTLTSAFCAVLLWREYAVSRHRLLLWSSLSFVAWAANNGLVFTDMVMFPDIDLSLARTSAALAGVSLLLYALVWDAS